jgi:hypothetical protein
MDGCDRRVCVAVLVNRFGTRDQIDGGGYFANVANGVDRGTYRLAPIVSRKDAKAQRGGTVFCLAVSRRRTRIRFPLSHAKTQRGQTVDHLTFNAQVAACSLCAVLPLGLEGRHNLCRGR